jgi:hypothetical protein
MTSIEVTESGRSLQNFLEVTEEQLAHSLNEKVLADAARSDTKELASWVERAKWDGMPQELGHHVAGFLQDDAVDIFAGAWGKCYELKKCLEESRTNPRETSVVALTDHDFTYELSPTVDILVDGVKLGAIPFLVTLSCQISGLELQVRNGAIAGVRTGSADGSAEIACARNTIWQRDLAHVSLPGKLHFKNAIRL